MPNSNKIEKELMKAITVAGETGRTAGRKEVIAVVKILMSQIEDSDPIFWQFMSSNQKAALSKLANFEDYFAKIVKMSTTQK